MHALMLALLFSANPAAAGDGHTHLTWYGHATFVVTTPKGTVLAFDPWFHNPKNPDPEVLAKIPKIDFALVSHGHFDHTGDAIPVGQKGAKLVAPFELGTDLVAAGYPKDQATMMTLANAGGTLDLTDEVKVTFVPAVHSSGFSNPSNPQGPPEYGGNPVGYVVQIAGGPTIYHTGDTDAFSDMKSRVGDRFKVDLMLACIGGHFTMDPEGAALAASWVHPKTIVPMHYGTFPVLTGTPDELAKALKARKLRTRLLVLEPGKEKSF